MSKGEKASRGTNVSDSKSQVEPLIQRRAAMARRVDALFRAMSTDYLLREQFVTDPTQIMSEYVNSARMPPQTASVGNQLLYAVMSNRGLLGWLRDYSIKHHGQPPSRHRFIRDFGRAVVEHGGHHVVLALVRSSVEQEGVFVFDEAFLPVIFGIFAQGVGRVFAAGTEMSTGTDFGTMRSGTEMSTGRTVAAGTEMSTGTDFGTMRSGTEMSTGRTVAEGTEMSTGTDFGTMRSGTEMSTGRTVAEGTEMSTGTDFGTMRSGTEMSTGRTVAEGTEMSTGTDFGTMRSGTEMSTGRTVAEGTEMSTGTDFGTMRSGTEMSTGRVFAAGTEMSTGTDFGTMRSGTEMSTGRVFAAGTEISTGTDFGTMRSGTEMSTGRTFAAGLFGSSHVAVTLEALAQYAAQLRESGALDVVWAE